jgi:hypothetical protein
MEWNVLFFDRVTVKSKLSCLTEHFSGMNQVIQVLQLKRLRNMHQVWGLESDASLSSLELNFTGEKSGRDKL